MYYVSLEWRYLIYNQIKYKCRYDMYSTSPDGILSLTFCLRDDPRANNTPCHCTCLFRLLVGGGQTIVDFWSDRAPWIDHKTPGRTTAAEGGGGAAETEQIRSVLRDPLTGVSFSLVGINFLGFIKLTFVTWYTDIREFVDKSLRQKNLIHENLWSTNSKIWNHAQ